ncbi:MULTISPECIES: AAA family ATPase [Culturomica]|jgi:MoxR-like ATPase|uniref:AAA family ATPase n=1 Tax=Culturomica TaxID=1926651 RepID=UPI00033CF895|nr:MULTISPECIES: AAA family ATPase [Odoribacteraceae]RHV95629.1 AAA family ATPase [Odoribacter sp. OF09-27XD]CCZ06244.1 aTPase associated with various cellular activities AAA_3 [Odoribacter sp. CAG:788]HBO27127.1 AAA family ATPase [Culturomica sp.]
MKDTVQLIDQLKAKYEALKQEIGQKIVGQDEVINKVLISIFSNGHCLLIGVPGLAKTLLVTAISETLDLKYSRIQFTPDLMPSDIIGTEILDNNREFKFIEGPLFANIILADEINRTPPKTQSALLEAMQERAITAAGVTRRLKQPFFVLATQNPIEQEGTYPLPEAQLDRFMFSVILDYPTLEEEIAIVENTTGEGLKKLNKIISGEEILEYQAVICKMPVPKHITEYAVKLVAKTRPGKPGAHELAEKYLNWGAGPRASQFLISGAKTYAALQGKYAPDMEDVKYVAEAILRHRIFKNYKAEAEHITVEELIREFMK